MLKQSLIFVVLSAFFANCSADTFVNNTNNQQFDGYATSFKKVNLTQVKPKTGKSKFIDIDNYTIVRNNSGRKDNVYIFVINDQTSLVAQIEEFEKYIEIYANQGPLLILLEIDTPDIRTDLALRICEVIEKVDYCTTAAFIKSGRYRGALGNSAIIALSCDKLFMNKNAKLGGQTKLSPKDEVYSELVYDEAFVTEDVNTLWQEYYLGLAEKKEFDPLLVAAFVDENLEVSVVARDEKFVYVPTSKLDPEKEEFAILSKKDDLVSLDGELAKKLGIAQNIVEDEKELYQLLSASKAKKIRDRRLSRSRTAVIRTSRTISRMLDRLENTEAFTQRLLTYINNIEETISNTSRAGINLKYGIDRDSYGLNKSAIGIETDELVDIMEDHDAFIDDLLANLVRQVNQYRDITPITEKYPDLRFLTETLQSQRLQAQELYKENLLRFRYTETPAERLRYFRR
ncbi:MAG: hypothetical protein ISS77_03265 [Phycisphaerae bacterium]|nr:hypothetical protein [Phycisphaerae bacterium]